MKRTFLSLFALGMLLRWTIGCGQNACEKLADLIDKKYKSCGLPTSTVAATGESRCDDLTAKHSRCLYVCLDAASCDVLKEQASAEEQLRIANCNTWCLTDAVEVPSCSSQQVLTIDRDGRPVCVNEFELDMTRPSEPPSDGGASDDGGCGANCGQATAVAAGQYHSCAVVGGVVKCWGANGYKQVGTAAVALELQPTPASPPLTDASAVAAGLLHSCATTKTQVWCWGASAQGQVGSGSINPELPVYTGLDDVTAVSAGDDHTCAIRAGAAWCWGSNAMGKLGIGGASENPKETPQPLSLTSGVTAIAAGAVHTCAIVSGAIKCWGDGAFGQLGNNSSGSTTPVDGPALPGVTSIAAGYGFTCAVTNGAVKCWGSNSTGQLGAGNTDDSPTPVDVVGLSSGATFVSAGVDFACAIVSGAAKCWGNNSHKQLGAPSAGAYEKQPIDVAGLSSGVTALATGYEHACAVVSGGVKCWGRNESGQLGDRTSGPGNESATAVNVQF